MNTLTENKFGTGGIKSPPDKRDFKWNDLGGSTAPSFSWALGYDIETKLPSRLSRKNQGQSSSCGGQATSYYGEVLEAIATKSEEERSAKFIYAQTHQGAGGSWLRDNFDIVVNQGWARESILSSYINGALPDEAWMTNAGNITQEVRNDATSAQALSYALVDRNIDAVAQAVANNYGAVILIQGSNNGTWLSPNPKAPVAGDTTWNHFLYVGKALMIDGKKYLVVMNSWGDSVGAQGWQMIGEDFFDGGYILECRTLVYKNKPLQFVFNMNLYMGMRNGDVLQLQNRLVKWGYATFVPTGFFGSQTFAAVRAYQKSKNILSTGFCGPLTRAALNVVA